MTPQPTPADRSPAAIIAAGVRWLALGLAAAYIVLCVVLVCRRLGYPFELEWLEGASVDEVRRILAGQPLYVKPSIAFTPLLYTPAYFYVSAALCRLVGTGFLPLRLISCAASATTIVLAARMVWRETGSRAAALLTAGLFCATFGWTDGWFDLARTDAMFLALAFAAVYVLRWHRSSAAAIVAGLLISASFFTKQTGLALAVPLALWCATLGWRPLVAFLGTVALAAGGGTIAFDLSSHGWFRYYVFTLPALHPAAREALVGFWRHDLLGALPVAAVAGAVHLAGALRRAAPRTAIFYGLIGAGFIGASWASRLHSLGYVNVLLPAYLIVAVMFGNAMGDWTRALHASGRHAWAVTGLYALAAAQLLRLAYAPASFVPTAADVEAGRALRQEIAASAGDVFTPAHGFLPSLEGRPTFAHIAAMADVLRGGHSPVADGLSADIARALAEHRFTVVIAPAANTSVQTWLPLDRDYRPVRLVVRRSSRFWRRETLYVPRE